MSKEDMYARKARFVEAINDALVETGWYPSFATDPITYEVTDTEGEYLKRGGLRLQSVWGDSPTAIIRDLAKVIERERW